MDLGDEIRKDIDVEITLSSDPKNTSIGTVSHKFPKQKNGRTEVILKNGDKGWVNRIINSDKHHIKRIMDENQYTENKENFHDNTMRHKSIPQAVQAFLNSDGGYVYVGVRDTGSLKERLVGLDWDFEQISKGEKMKKDKLFDILSQKVRDTLRSHLSSDTDLGRLVHIEPLSLNGVQIAIINVKPSTKPWFFHNTNKNKPQYFDLYLNGKKIEERKLDYFYIRDGGSKLLLSTHEEFYKYLTDHFKL